MKTPRFLASILTLAILCSPIVAQDESNQSSPSDQISSDDSENGVKNGEGNEEKADQNSHEKKRNQNGDQRPVLPEIEVTPTVPDSGTTTPPVVPQIDPTPNMQIAPAFPPTNVNPIQQNQQIPTQQNPVQTQPFNRQPSTNNAQNNNFAPKFPSLSDSTFGNNDRFGENTGIFRGTQPLFDTPAAASIRSREEISQRQAPDMFHAIQNEVGVMMQRTSAGQGSPFVRGLTGQQVLILVDGIRLNNSIFRRGPNQYFNTIDPGMIDHIEVIRGQGSVLWGSDAIGGAINVVTRGADIHHGLFHGDYRGGGFTQYFNSADTSSYSRFNVEGWVGTTGFFGGGSYFNANDLETGFDGAGRQPGTSYDQYAGDIKFNYLLSQDSMLTVALQHFEQDNVPRSDRFPGYPQDRNNSNSLGGARFFDPQQRDLAYIRYQSLFPMGGMFDALTVTGSYHRQREVQTRGVPTVRFQETDVETAGFQAAVSRDLADFGKWTTGFDWYYDDVDSPFGGTASGPIVPDDAWYRRAGWFMNWDFPVTCRLDATAGVRYESIETAGTPVVNGTPVRINPTYDDWIAQAGLNYKLSRNSRLFASIAEGFRAPNLDDLMANNPNVLQQGQSLPSLGLNPEHSINYEVGVKTDHDRLRTQASYFWLDIQDNIVSITAAPNTFASANQDSFVQGVEFSGEFLFDESWSLYGNVWHTVGDNRVTNAPLSRIPPTQGILGLRCRPVGTSSYFELYSWMSDGQDRLDPVRDLNDERIPIGGTPSFATLNMRMGRAFGVYDQHRVSLSLENITDEAYLVHGSGVRGSGFSARVGYSFEY